MSLILMPRVELHVIFSKQAVAHFPWHSFNQTRQRQPSSSSIRCRHATTSVLPSQGFQDRIPQPRLRVGTEPSNRSFQRVPTGVLLRSILLGQTFKSTALFKPTLYLLEKIANSKSVFLDVDRNPLIRGLVLPLIYRHFCAGRNDAEVRKTVGDIKKIGYSGAILCYAGEIMASKDVNEVETVSDEEMTKRQIEAWRDVQLATLNAVSEGDYVGIKYTGAGSSISHALKTGKSPPPSMVQALDTICKAAQTQKKRVWFDAEQTLYHPTIDNWTIDLMRRYNHDDALVLTTIQAYLKSSRQTTERYLRLAQQEGWALGIKLVRGAYIGLGGAERQCIHDMKEQTDQSYDGIASDLISKTWPGFDKSRFPKVDVFLAGHNTESIRKAADLVATLAAQGELDHRVGFGQLQGMADDIGGELISMGETAVVGDQSQTNGTTTKPESVEARLLGVPKVYKCLVWGSVKECLHYLVRRAVENRGAADRLSVGLAEMKRELRRRVLRF